MKERERKNTFCKQTGARLLLLREREQHQLPRDALAWDEGLRAGQLGSAGLGKDL